MQATEDKAFIKALVEAMAQGPRPGPPHVTELTNCVRQAWVRRHMVDKLPAATEELIARWSGGLAWQGLVEAIVKRQGWECWLQPQREVDGIALTPDAIVNEPGGPVVWEMKATGYSYTKPLSEMGGYLAQVRSYCALLNIPKARLVLLHKLGDYKRGPGTPPRFRVVRLVFPAASLAEWRLELRRRRDIFVAAGSPPEGAPVAAWLCRDCVEGRASACARVSRNSKKGG